MKFSEYCLLKERQEGRIASAIRRKINEFLFKISARRWRTIPLREISDMLGQFGVTIEDEMLPPGSTNEGKTNMDLLMNGQPVNHYLILSWKRGELVDDYEINAYVS